MHCLASHPAAEARLLAEVDALGSEVEITAEHLPRLPYTEAVLMETLRLHPPGAFIIRESRTPVEARAGIATAAEAAASLSSAAHRRACHRNPVIPKNPKPSAQIGGYTVPPDTIMVGAVYSVQARARGPDSHARLPAASPVASRHLSRNEAAARFLVICRRRHLPLPDPRLPDPRHPPTATLRLPYTAAAAATNPDRSATRPFGPTPPPLPRSGCCRRSTPGRAPSWRRPTPAHSRPLASARAPASALASR